MATSSGLLVSHSTCGVRTLPLQRVRPKREWRGRARALLELHNVAVAEQSPAITWQVAVGAIAGITPFFVAGIEFNKRISAQRKCIVCGGSGLVKRDEYYFRCYSCGGFLPWQSWRRFFSGK
eukprot:c11002_g1_i1 orf=264-629(-)